MKKKKAQLTLDSFLNLKHKRRQFFYIDWNEDKPKAQWLHSKPNNFTWTQVVKFKEIGDIIICCNNPMSISKDDEIIQKINDNKKTQDIPNKIISFLKSHLQKCIRRGMTELAIKTAFALLCFNKDEFIRRLSIIVFEDVRAKVYYPNIIWLVSAVSKGFSLNKKMVNYLLSIVVDLCEDKTADEISSSIPNERDITISGHLDKIESYDTISEQGKSFLYSILFRMSYGGMTWDIDMLGGYLITWRERLKQGVIIQDFDYDKLKELHNFCEYTKIKKIEELTTEDFILEGVDFHCFPSLLDDIIKESRVNYTKQELKDTIWEYNSKINCRKDNTVLEKKLEIIWSDIKCILRKLQLKILDDIVILIKSNK